MCVSQPQILNNVLHVSVACNYNEFYVLNKYVLNKCIGDDTKAAARQSLNCIKNKKIKYGEKRFSICRMEFLHLAIWHDRDIDFAR